MAIVQTVTARIRETEESHKELARFLLVGLSGTLVNYAVLTLTYHFLHFPVFVAALLSNESAMITNFFCHEHWTFNGERHGSGKRRFLRYQLVATGGIIITTVVLTVLVHFGIQYLIANGIAIIVAVSWNFFMSHKWAWRRVPEEVFENVA